MDKQVVFSIIIPHRNIPALLQRCLDSIPQRSDTEVIIVDDNSSADTVDFSHFPGHDRQDVRIAFDKTGGGAGKARNIGLEMARGRWLLFADADDFFTRCLGDMLDNYADSDDDVVYFAAASCDTDYYTNATRGQFVNGFMAWVDTDRAQAEWYLRYYFGEPWCKLVRRSLVDEHAIRFDEVSLHNDTTFSYLVGHHARTVAIDRHAIYVVTARAGSLSNQTSPERRLARVDVFARRDKFFRSIGIHDTIMCWHLREVNKMIVHGEWQLARQAIGVLKRYDPSTASVLWTLVRRLPRSAAGYAWTWLVCATHPQRLRSPRYIVSHT